MNRVTARPGKSIIMAKLVFQLRMIRAGIVLVPVHESSLKFLSGNLCVIRIFVSTFYTRSDNISIVCMKGDIVVLILFYCNNEEVQSFKSFLT